MVGGGNYIEYQNLLDYCKRQQGAKKITYGTSELMNAQQFLTQVTTILVRQILYANLIVTFKLLPPSAQLSELGQAEQ